MSKIKGSDWCDQDCVKMTAILRSVQLGITSGKWIMEMIAKGTIPHVAEIVAKEKEKLPRFGVASIDN